jgi:hypothetical protein
MTISIIALDIMTLGTAIIKNKTKKAVGAMTISIMAFDIMTLSTSIIKKLANKCCWHRDNQNNDIQCNDTQHCHDKKMRQKML